jgi:glycosidase
VTVIYFNPLFEAASNHAYDTQDYYSIDHFFGNNAEFEQFVNKANEFGIRVILDGVFNHVSSDSAYFDRYGHFAGVGACESVSSQYRDW